MNDRDSFLHAIRENPEGEGLRLVFADWLEEQGDPLAEFIRIQCKLEPLRDRYGDPAVEELRKREEQMLGQYGAAWLGPLEPLLPDCHQFRVVFRRGLVEAVWIQAPLFLERADVLTSWCPVVQRVTLHDVRGRGAELAAAAGLARLRHLELDDWILPADAQALASSPHLGRLQTLQFWLGSRDEDAVCRALSAGPSLSRLQELRLLQLLGGLMAEDRAQALATRAEELAGLADRLWGRKLSRVMRPFEGRFPLCGDQLGRGLYAGWLPEDRQALAATNCWNGRVSLAVFDSQGALLEHAEPDFGTPANEDREVLDRLHGRLGFQAGLIHVKEFETETGLAVHHLPDHLTELAGSPDEPPHWVGEEERGFARDLSGWLQSKDFVIDWGNDYWAGPDGQIHSS
jgi:uncharacterized protein (TIGR02996 family)